MKNHRIRGKKYEYVYGERGTADPNNTSLLFIHGFSASKEMWGPIVKVGCFCLKIIVSHLMHLFVIICTACEISTQYIRVSRAGIL